MPRTLTILALIAQVLLRNTQAVDNLTGMLGSTGRRWAVCVQTNSIQQPATRLDLEALEAAAANWPL